MTVAQTVKKCPRKRKVCFKYLSPPHDGTKWRKAGKWVRQMAVEEAKAMVGSEPHVPYNLLCDILTDELISGPVIEAYFDMLAARQESSPAGCRKCCFLSSCVHSFFTERAHEVNKRSARNLEGFLGKITTTTDLILLPSNNEMHWHLLVVKVAEKKIEWYNSMPEARLARPYAVDVASALKEEMVSRGFLDATDYELVTVEDHRQQKTGYDCEVESECDYGGAHGTNNGFKIFYLRPMSSRLSASPHGKWILSGSSPPVGSMPKWVQAAKVCVLH
ncbi:hypothetical protein H6P81_013442 [Aristolochia fimbriata]|uniref:Ubiquitin-like protease family profile domain-containing protein n=1 Tax=Aristolochia fimbriata TaxID=158543 RepID=A0AAV7EF72_ARIFI|nr:hypothetical protein H6P81_013442 [Aristolochia fimbriata]